MNHRRTAVAVVLAATLFLAACGSDEEPAGTDSGGSSETKLDVQATFYPLAWMAERVGGETVEVSNLTPPGAEAHDLELTPSDVAALASADMVVYLSGFQPAVDDAMAETDATTFDAADHARLDLVYTGEHDHDHDHGDDGHAEDESHTEDEAHAHDEPHAEGDDHSTGDAHSKEGEEKEDTHSDEEEDAHGDDKDGATDPHFWLDPTRMTEVATAFATALGETDPDNADAYAANADALVADLEALDAEMAEGLADCERRDLVTSHTAFAYLADRYDLTQVGIAGLSPNDEPSPADLAELARFVEDNDVSTIYFETLVSPDVAETLANETGAATAMLDPLEGLTDQSDGEDYLAVMRSNLASLQAGQPCT